MAEKLNFLGGNTWYRENREHIAESSALFDANEFRKIWDKKWRVSVNCFADGFVVVLNILKRCCTSVSS